MRVARYALRVKRRAGPRRGSPFVVFPDSFRGASGLGDVDPHPSFRRMIRRSIVLGLALLMPRWSQAQFNQPLHNEERGAIALAELVRGLGVNVRVLMIGAHPDDEDTALITWLARGRQVETAYLSLTRGDGGQNLIGNELGEALGAIRTEELLAARRIDGGHQYFTRAYDFGFSKSAEETYQHWPKDELLLDVVTMLRDFRPHVIVAVFSGTPRDGHGHHQVSGLLAREAFDLAGDSVRFPRAATQGRAPWTPLKFYRRFRGTDTAPTIRMDVGEYSPLRGRSYAEIAAESRSQHKSQAFGALQRKGAVIDVLRLEASRVNTVAADRSLFDGIDTTWARLASRVRPEARVFLDSIPPAIAAVQRTYDPYSPVRMLQPLDRVRRLVDRAFEARFCGNGDGSPSRPCRTAQPQIDPPDLERSLSILRERIDRAALAASGLGIEASGDHETWAADEPIRPTVTLYNRGVSAVEALVEYSSPDGKTGKRRMIAPFASAAFPDTINYGFISRPRWLIGARTGDMFSRTVDTSPTDGTDGPAADVMTIVNGVAVEARRVPFAYRYADPIKGEIHRPLAIVPAVSITVDQPVQYVPAERPFDRVIRVELRSASNHSRTARVALLLPQGLTADPASRTIGLPDYAGNFGAEGEAPAAAAGRRVAGQTPMRVVAFRVRGVLPEGRHTITAVAESEGQRFTTGYTLIDYDHIRPQRLFREATIALSAVRLQVADALNVAYVPGVGDNVGPMLAQLGIPITVIEPERLAGADLSRYTTLVVGPRAYESSPALIAANTRLMDFVRSGRTLVVQYGQFEMATPGVMPYPVAFANPADRVTEEDTPVRPTDPASPLLNTPNRISPSDWQGWVQERSLYMPRSHDQRYRSVLSMNDTGEQPNDGAILVAAVGKGTYVYTTLALFRQLPAGVPGAARLFVNLLSADQRAAGPIQPPPRP